MASRFHPKSRLGSSLNQSRNNLQWSLTGIDTKTLGAESELPRRYGMNWPRVFTLASFGISAMIVVIVSFAWAQTPQGKATPLIVGSWKLNIEKSNLPGAPPQFFQIRKYKLREDGFLVGLVVSANAQGNPTFLQFTAKSDGKDYPEYTDDLLAELVATGKQTSLSYSEKITDAYVTEWTDKENGKVTAQGTRTISKDGKTMTLAVVSPASRQLVFDRQ